MINSKKIAVITPYFNEPLHYLSRCIESVERQEGVKCEHFLISDGNPISMLDEYNVRHIRIDKNHNDNGNTPRGIGALLAIAENFDAICLLDADNWYEPNHIFSCLNAASSSDLNFEEIDYIYSRRIFRHPNGVELNWKSEKHHIDTSELILLKGSFSVLSRWSLMPKAFSPICDKVFYLMMKSSGLKAAFCDKKTVNFTMLYPHVYQSMNLPIPQEANHSIDWEKITKFTDGLSENERKTICRNIGVDERTNFKITPYEIA